MAWAWDPNKNDLNRRNHGVGFETAQLVFDDRRAISRLDSYPFEHRWQTIGLVGRHHILVIHTWSETVIEAEGPVGRIISARKASARERRAYEQGSF